MKKTSWVAIVKKKIWLWSSSVIKTVNMKYNRIDIKWRAFFFFYRFMMVVHKNVLEYIITLVVVKNKVRLKKWIKKFQIWQNSIPPVFDGLFHVIKSLIIVIASYVRGYIMMLKLHEWSQEIWSKNVIFKCKNYERSQ
jgi:hypothetical protein